VALVYWFYERRFSHKHRGRRWSVAETAEGLRISQATARRALHAAEAAGLLTVQREPGCKLVVSTRDVPEADREPWPLYGPIPWVWFVRAAGLPGKALHTGVICWLLAGWQRFAEFDLVLKGWSDFGLTRFSAYRGLAELERAGLVSVRRSAGRSPVVTILGGTP
jgi:DNA-binding transcriptional regulator YhcF (GntR family)